MKCLLICLLSLLAVGAGCEETFTGEWVEQGVVGPSGTLPSPTGGRREALQFDGISTVRTGAMSEVAQVVDAQTVQADPYFVFDGGRSAQFGSLIGHLENGGMTVTSAAGTTQRLFTRVHGHSIFPPPVALPQLTMKRRNEPNVPSQLASAWAPALER